MSSQITNYKCPACTGPLKFVGASGMLECEYCGSKHTVADIEALYAQKEAAAVEAHAHADHEKEAALRGWSEEEARGMRAYTCPSCSAELICDETTAATSCPYCGNPTIVPGQFSGFTRPDYVLPFRLDKKAAQEALKNFYKGKQFLPKSFLTDNHIEEIKGVYVPFWLYSAKAWVDFEYEGQNKEVRTRGDVETTTTSHYRVIRQGELEFQHVPADASTKMPDAHMDAVEPYDYSDLRAFSTAYLPGFLADKFDQDSNVCFGRAKERMENTARAQVRGTVSGYDSVDERRSNIRLHDTQAKHALMPVWLLATRWKDKSFLFAMNGQTGKMVGDLPVDWGKVAMTFAAISLPVMVFMALLAFVLFGG
ncbi:MAG TPA: hypothetical protein PKW24_04530 [Clostridiales bacterium]|jgi:DNA-directed RNA polymerase subunit RPC12/RpoP|nr:hypothetical protein [Clostridiales bacterium]